MSWQLELLGEPRLVLPAPAEATPATPSQQVLLIDRDAGLLAYVALAGPGPARRVAELLWPGRDDKQALNNLRQRLHKLRRSTGARLLEMGQTLSLAADLQLAAPEAAQAADSAEPPPLRRLLHPFEYQDAPDFA